MQIAEADWKVYKKVFEVARERLSARLLGEIALIAMGEGSANERFWNVSGHVRECAKVIRGIFGEYRRSSALPQLLLMRARDLVTDEEFATFSEETRSRIDRSLTLEDE